MIAQATACAVPAIDIARLIRAIAHAQRGNWAQAGGALKIDPRTWKAYARQLPYVLAQHQGQAGVIASQIIGLSLASCVRFGVSPTVAIMADSWREGLSGAMKRAKLGKHSEFSRQVESHYNQP